MSSPGAAPDTIEYQGQQIKLTKVYGDYDEYKEDPNNIAASEIPKVQKLVATTPIAKKFNDMMSMLQAMQAIEFPGYGSTQFGEKPQPDGSVLSLHSIEIPRANKDRFFLFRGRGGVYTLIDDFVYGNPSGNSSGNPFGKGEIFAVTDTNGKLIYTASDGTKIIEHSPTSRSSTAE